MIGANIRDLRLTVAKYFAIIVITIKLKVQHIDPPSQDALRDTRKRYIELIAPYLTLEDYVNEVVTIL